MSCRSQNNTKCQQLTQERRKLQESYKLYSDRPGPATSPLFDRVYLQLTPFPQARGATWFSRSKYPTIPWKEKTV